MTVRQATQPAFQERIGKPTGLVVVPASDAFDRYLASKPFEPLKNDALNRKDFNRADAELAAAFARNEAVRKAVRS